MVTLLNLACRRVGALLLWSTFLLASLLPARADEFEVWRPASMPALHLPTLDGSDRDLSADAGRVVLVHFFATWCEPCRDELRSLERLAATFEARPLRILAVDVGEPADRVRRFLERNGISPRFPVLIDFDKQAMRAWGVEMLPTSYALDRALCPLWKVAGTLEWDSGPTLRLLEDEVAKPEPLAMSNSKEICIVKGGNQ